MKYILYIILFIQALNGAVIAGNSPHSIFSKWEVNELLPGGRFDAITYAGDNVVIIGSRGKNRGHIFRSIDLGLTWQKIENVTSDEITCLVSGGEGIVYMLTGEANFYRSSDYGKTWQWIAKISYNKNNENYTLSYGLMVTDHGTLLVSDTESSGGHIYRSVDQGNTWYDLGKVSERPLYRFQRTGNGIIINGWKGSIYKSQNDGISWQEVQHLCDTPLYATEYLGAHVTLQASEDGQIFRSTNYGETWQKLDYSTSAADDFVKLGTGAVLLTTYRDERELHISLDYGKTWTDIGKVNPQVLEDWFDHVIYIEEPGKNILIGGTNQGFVVRAEINQDRLYRTINEKNYKDIFPEKMIIDIGKVMKGKLTDYNEINEPEDIEIDGDYAYLPCRDGNNVAIINISEPEHPVLAASLRHPEMLDAFGVDIKDDFLYIVSMSNQKLLIADVSEPSSPQVITTLTVGGEGEYNSDYDSYHTRLRKVIVQRGYAYVTHSNEGRLYIVDVNDPYHPKIVSHLETTDGAFTTIVKNNYAYLAGCGPGASVIVADIRNKKKPRLVKKIYDEQNLSCTCDFAIKGNYLFATGYGDNTFLTFDISSPENISLKSIFRHPNMIGPGRLVIDKNVAYIINSTNDSMCAIEISNPLKPHVDYFISDRLIDKTYGIDHDDNYIYLAGRDSKTFVVLKK